eukprot:scaffold120524_cov69-Phaeocystis_antarctica.AAC.2
MPSPARSWICETNGSSLTKHTFASYMARASLYTSSSVRVLPSNESERSSAYGRRQRARPLASASFASVTSRFSRLYPPFVSFLSVWPLIKLLRGLASPNFSRRLSMFSMIDSEVAVVGRRKLQRCVSLSAVVRWREGREAARLAFCVLHPDRDTPLYLPPR